ncbi:hypothetical protein SCHAM137S_06443 [Streptomyces chartreusis]
MNALTYLDREWVADVAAFASHAWQTTFCIWLSAGLLRLTAERSRRKTLVALVTQAPASTTVVQSGGLGGPAMSIQVGQAHAEPAPLPRREQE